MTVSCGKSEMEPMPETYLFNVNFVYVVEKYPALYNYNLPEYSNRNFMEKSFLEIACALKFPVEQCKLRWKNIRSSYLRHLRSQPRSGSGATQSKRPYYLQSHLAFLLPYTKPRKQISNLEFEEREVSIICQSQDFYNNVDEGANVYDTPSSIVEREESVQESDGGVQENIYSEMCTPIVSTPSCREPLSPIVIPDYSDETAGRPKKRKRENFEDLAAEYVKSRLGKEDKPKSQFWHFFQSLLPDVEKFDAKQSIRFRKRVLDLIDEINANK